MTVTPADHRYLQVARTLRKEIVDGVYPVGSQLPTEQQLCERFEVSRYTVREANVFRWAGRMLGDAARVRLRARVEARVLRHGAP